MLSSDADAIVRIVQRSLLLADISYVHLHVMFMRASIWYVLFHLISYLNHVFKMGDPDVQYMVQLSCHKGFICFCRALVMCAEHMSHSLTVKKAIRVMLC